MQTSVCLNVLVCNIEENSRDINLLHTKMKKFKDKINLVKIQSVYGSRDMDTKNFNLIAVSVLLSMTVNVNMLVLLLVG